MKHQLSIEIKIHNTISYENLPEGTKFCFGYAHDAFVKGELTIEAFYMHCVYVKINNTVAVSNLGVAIEAKEYTSTNSIHHVSIFPFRDTSPKPKPWDAVLGG